MSDPVTNVEIEDVLSSVKRLVSAGNKGDATREPVQPAVPAQPERFVLTPALRVSSQEDATESLDQPEDVWATAPEEPAIDDEETTLVMDMPTDEVKELAPTADRDSLEATIAELEAAVTAQPDEWEPDGSEVTSVPTWETVSYPALDDVEDAIAVDEPAASETVSVDEERNPAEDLSRIGLTFAHSQLYAVETTEDEDADTDYGDELAPDTAVAGQDEDIDAFLFGSGGVVDEEMLRQMVVEIVRDELQGKLGERITRNVRKMVRREIHRVITTQEFD